MKKFIFAFLLIFLFTKNSLAESFYFKGCKLSNAVMGNYIINLQKNVIEVNLEAIDGSIQNFSDKIKSIKENKITSEKIKSGKGENVYYQYFLNPETKTVIKLEFVKESAAEMEVFRLKQQRKSQCKDVKAGWDQEKIQKTESNKEQEQISAAQKKIKKEQSSIVPCQGKDYKKWTQCKGSFKAETGYTFDGLFVNGIIVKGISIYPGGAKYVGEFKIYKPHGFGTFVWSNGDKYYGEWIDGKINGNGTKIWKDGREYSGTFKNDKMHGNGTLFYPDGKKYAGQFINGKRHGEGTFTYSDGSAYIGKFIAGEEDGVGECVAIDGSSIACSEKTDTQVKDFSGKDTRNISIEAKKWVRISQYETNSGKGKKIMNKLNAAFIAKAEELCKSKENYNILDKKIEILDIDDTPAYGLETKLKIGINGVVECI